MFLFLFFFLEKKHSNKTIYLLKNVDIQVSTGRALNLIPFYHFNYKTYFQTWRFFNTLTLTYFQTLNDSLMY